MADAAGAESECELPMDGEPLSGDDCKCPAEEMIFFVIPPGEEGGTPTRNPTTQVTFASETFFVLSFRVYLVSHLLANM